jgi:cytochrome P450
MAEKIVAERFGPDRKEIKDMLGSFVRSGMQQRQIEAEVLFQLQAGSDTVVATLRGTFLYLLTNPRVHAKLLREFDFAATSGHISTPITNDELRRLTYLQAVLKEAMRIQPPFPGRVPKKVPPSGDTIKGQFVPGGTNISHNNWSVQHNASVYGPDVDVFRPERWIDSSEENKMRMEQTLDLNFGYGRWGCLGKSVAMRELDKVIFELLRNFEFELLRPECPWKSRCYDLFLVEGMWVKVTTREVV